MAARIDWKRIQEMSLRNVPYLLDNLQIAAEGEDVRDMYAVLESLCSVTGAFLSEMYDTKTARIVWDAAQEINWSRKNPNPKV